MSIPPIIAYPATKLPVADANTYTSIKERQNAAIVPNIIRTNIRVRVDNRIDSLMQQINMGIAAYDGLMTGIKILRRVRGFFGGKNKKY